jgi:hypothetical protein
MSEKISKNLLSPLLHTHSPTSFNSGANLNANPNFLNFGRVRINSPVYQSFFLNNQSEKPVSFTVSSPPEGFNVSITSGQISAGGSVSIQVTFSPSHPGHYSGYLNISPGIASVSLQAEVYDPDKGKK